LSDDNTFFLMPINHTKSTSFYYKQLELKQKQEKREKEQRLREQKRQEEQEKKKN